jgi:hypothetical protein
VELQQELSREQANGRAVAEGYAAKVTQLEADLLSRTKWVRDTEERLTREINELKAALDERTAWAVSLDEQVRNLQAGLNSYRASRWVKLGRAIGLGPDQAAS